MSLPRLVRVEEIESVTYDFLWRASNEVLRHTPAISQHLGKTLVSRVPEDGMSSFAKRMHCQQCGGLMVAGKVRVRTTKKRCKVRNKVLRTCPSCEKVNKDDGVVRRVQITADKLDIEALRKTAAREKRRESTGEGKDKGQEPKITKAQSATKDAKSKKKRKRSKSLDGASSRPENKRSGLAASFLFEPL